MKTAQSNVKVVQRLSVAIEQRKVSWPGGVSRQAAKTAKEDGGEEALAKPQSTPRIDWEVLTNEMKRYEYQIGPTGQISYGAPSGHHDDYVMALALANHGKWQAENGCVQIFRIQSRWMQGCGGGSRNGGRGEWRKF